MPDVNDTKNMRAGLTRNESILLSTLSEKGRTIFSLKDIVDELDCSYDYAKVLANNLTKERWSTALRRGTSLIVPLSAGVKPSYTEHEFVIASHLVSLYYIAYWSALNFHGFTEQTPFTVFVATTKRTKSRKTFSVNYRFVTLNKRKFFGFVPTAIGTSKVNISNPEKTLADALDHPEYCGGITEVAKSLWNAREKLSMNIILDYAGKMGNSAIIKRLGFLVESLGVEVKAKTILTMEESISSGTSALDPTRPRMGKHSTKWNLLVNISKEALEEGRRGY